MPPRSRAARTPPERQMPRAGCFSRREGSLGRADSADRMIGPCFQTMSKSMRGPEGREMWRKKITIGAKHGTVARDL